MQELVIRANSGVLLSITIIEFSFVPEEKRYIVYYHKTVNKLYKKM